ncbi:MAG TPA: GTP-binding protein [Burkholderiaceae bacterium]|nr:GTP-binding protein [Burkholderiaceae bacterium]
MSPNPRGGPLLGPLPAVRPATWVMLMAGAPALMARSMQRWSDARPSDERWALIRTGDAVPVVLPPQIDVSDFAGGCACCVAASAFALAIARVLRRGAVERLFIELAPSADPGQIADALWSGPLAAHLARVEIVAMVAGPCTPAQHGASDVLLVESASAAGPDDVLLRALTSVDAGADPALMVAPPAGVDWSELRSRLDALAAPERWRWLAEPPPTGSADLRQRRVWPAAVLFDRLRAEAALRALAAHPAVAQVRAVIRTRRDWYAWRDNGVLAPWAPTASRRESRIEYRLRADVPIDLAEVDRHWDVARG